MSQQITGEWPVAIYVHRNNFQYKSLSCWAFNPAVGCATKCLSCYVPQVSTIKLGHILKPLGVDDPDAQWGDYVFVRQANFQKFKHSVKVAQNTPVSLLNGDGNRSVMFSTTTDSFQITHDPKVNWQLQQIVRTALREILDNSTLNVRILTRWPNARLDFPLMKEFGNRLMFGMSIPTLNNKLSRIYEPNGPAPTKRMETLMRAKDEGLHVYVAVAPVYPDCDEDDMEATLDAIKQLDPMTIFMEPINIRAENIARIEKHAASQGVHLETHHLKKGNWPQYAIRQLKTFETLASEKGLHDRLHLWPDPELKKSVEFDWLNKWWSRISEWPGK